MTLKFNVKTLEDTAVVGKQIATAIDFPACVYLNGEMGAGKTTLTKSILSGLGYEGAVTSPTYNLIQEYTVAQGIVYHMDLYRLDDPTELEFLALEDLWSDASIFLVEWPQKGIGFLPPANYDIDIEKINQGAIKTREVTMRSH